MCFRRRLVSRAPRAVPQLEKLVHRSFAAYYSPTGLGTSRAFAVPLLSVMCWAACDRLARIATRLGLADRAVEWRANAVRIAAFVDERCWNTDRMCFVSTAGGNGLDASLLLLAELGIVRADDPRFIATVDAIGGELKRGDFIFRYVERDDFGEPENAFLVCTFWYVSLAATAVATRRGVFRTFARLPESTRPLADTRLRRRAVGNCGNLKHGGAHTRLRLSRLGRRIRSAPFGFRASRIASTRKGAPARRYRHLAVENEDGTPKHRVGRAILPR